MTKMAKKGFFMFVAFAALALASEIEDAEQKKRGAGKPSALNAIPTGAQKTDYTYNIYSPNAQNPSQSYHNSVPNSFYPSQGASQYYSPSNSPETSVTNNAHTQSSPQTTQSQFVPLNFIPNPGYQSKYQIIPKPSQNVQLAVIQQPAIAHSPMLQLPHSFFSPNPTNHIGQSAVLGPQFSFGPSYQPLSFGSHFLSPPSAMVVLPQSHPTLYNNLAYPNPTQSFYNYYPSAAQAKYSYASGPSPSAENVQSSVPQSISKEDTAQSTDFVTSSDTNSAYKNAYSTRNTYTKI